jgi:hypothetical protein
MVVTFVTSFFHIYDQEYDTNKTVAWRVERFREIASSGIKICLYVSADQIHLIPREYPNVHVIESPKLFVEAVCENMELELPQQRSILKDTAKYMYVINSKTDLMTDAIQRNAWDSTHFAWIDFNISHVFSEKPRTLRFLKDLDQYEFPEKCMLIPGCWSKYDNVNIGHVTECVYWRFCGGFFIGDAASILRFGDLYNTKFPEFIKTTRRLVWEVNFWAWLEVNSDWNPQWYAADHNDSILTNLTCATIAQVLKPDSEEINYDYPVVPLFHPGSASYLKFQGEHLLNTRYVNYWYYENGTYLFYDGHNIIQNKNMFSRLVEENGVLMPMDYQEMKDDTIELPRFNMYSRGIEDVRLYEHQGRVRFIATTVGYHTTGGNRMMIGNYDYKTRTYSDAQLIESPTNAHCEKNWVPIPSVDGAERFVYGWNAGAAAPRTPPADVANSALPRAMKGFPYIPVIVTVKGNKCTFLNDAVDAGDVQSTIAAGGVRGGLPPAKGSSAFIEYNGELIGVTHFSEDAMPRRYFHMLIVLDKTTYAPIRYSKPFVFEKVGIEFCIGFDACGDKYRFWISRFDRDPVLFEVNTSIISFHNIYGVHEKEGSETETTIHP